MSFNFFCVGSAIAAVLASSQGVIVQGSVDGLIESGARSVSLAQQTESVSSIQQVLDDFCKEKFASLCKSGDKKFCDRTAIARFGTGIQSQTTDEWRCYDAATVASDKREVHCVDNCGTLLPCLGSVQASTTVHATRGDEIAKLVDRESVRRCSPSQKAANAYCKTQMAGSVARKDAGRKPVDQSIEWRCYDPSSLAYEQKSTCASNCGEEVQCHGGRIDKISEDVSAKHLTRNAEIIKKVNEGKPSCAHRCAATEINPPRCVTREEDGLSSGQVFLNEYCQSVFNEFCERTGDAAYCNKTVVARKESGREVEGFPGLYSEQLWRCFSAGEMSSENNSVCINDCGEEVSCVGVIGGVNGTHFTRPEVAEKIAEAKSQHCQKS